MAILTQERLTTFLKAQAGPCVSIYMPTHRRHPGTQQDPIRFKNCLREAERLLADDHSPAEIQELLDPVAALPNLEFWRHQADGLAILRSSDVLEEFRVPQRVPELVVVADSFHVRPLIRSLNTNLRYVLIALGRKRVEVFEGTEASLTPVEVPGVPGAMAEFAARRPGRRALSAHSEGRGGGVRRVHGAGGTEASVKDDLVPYFRAVDRAVGRALRHETVPVILAGVEYYFPIYRDVSRLKGLANGAVHGSPDAMTPEELHTRARPVAEAVLRDNQERALEKYQRAKLRGRSADRLEDIVMPARRGGVRRLFVAWGVQVWGTVEPTSGRVHRTDGQQGSHDDDVLDDVAEAVFLHGGDVIMLPRERMPDGMEVVAELR